MSDIDFFLMVSRDWSLQCSGWMRPKMGRLKWPSVSCQLTIVVRLSSIPLMMWEYHRGDDRSEINYCCCYCCCCWHHCVYLLCRTLNNAHCEQWLIANEFSLISFWSLTNSQCQSISCDSGDWRTNLHIYSSFVWHHDEARHKQRWQARKTCTKHSSLAVEFGLNWNSRGVNANSIRLEW